MPKILSLYLDELQEREILTVKYPSSFSLETGSHSADTRSTKRTRVWFRTAHADFCDAWKITYPLHSYDIRAQTENFAWLGKIEERERTRFMRQISSEC